MGETCETVTVLRGGVAVRINADEYNEAIDGPLYTGDEIEPVAVIENAREYSVKEAAGKFFVVSPEGKKSTAKAFDADGYATAPEAIAAIAAGGFSFVPGAI